MVACDPLSAQQRYSHGSSSVRLARTRPPKLPDYVLARHALEAWLPRILGVPTTIIQAPAGFGKTTLLAQLLRALQELGHDVRWLSIGAVDREPEALMAALTACWGLPEALPAESMDRRLVRLANWLAEAGEPSCLLLDDADRLSSTRSGRLLAELLEALPAGFHVICAGRGAPELPRARERGYGRLFELGVADLSFTAAEVLELLEVTRTPAPPAPELERFLRRSEGWPMIVRRECANAAATGTHAFERLTGKRHDVAAFFEAEVLHSESPEMLRVLEAAAIAEQINGAMASALTGSENAHALLDEACERGLFITATDDSRQWYRLHRLFGEALRQRLERRSPWQAQTLHRRAAEWYESSGGLIEAVDHAIQAGDAVSAARIFETHSDEFYETGHESAILPVASRIPADLRSRHPRLLLTMSWRLLAEWQFDKARTLLARAQARIDEMAAAGGCAAGELTELRHQLLHGQVMLAQFSEDLGFIERHTEGLLRNHSGSSSYIRASLHAALLFAAREQFRLARIDSLELQARQEISAVASRYVTVFLEGIIAPGNLMRGRIATALMTLKNALATALEVGGPSLAALAALPLAEAHYERGELDASLALLEKYLPHAREIGFADQLVSGCTVRSRIARIRGQRQVALLVLEEAAQFAREHSFEKLLLMSSAERIDALCQYGETAEATRVAAQIGLRRSADSVMPRPRVTRARAALAYAWTSLALAQGRGVEASKVARKWRNLTETAGATRDAARWSVRLAVLLRRAGDETGARRELQRAFAAATPLGLTQLFAEEAQALAPLLTTEGAVAAAANRECSPIRKPAVPLAEGRLSPREIEILTLVGDGLSNAEIGVRLNLVEGSVKWHLQRIYDKIGTRRRLIAVDRARRMGMLR